MKPLSLRLLFGTFWLVSMVQAQEVQLGADEPVHLARNRLWRVDECAAEFKPFAG